MKSRLIILFLLLLCNVSYAENLTIIAKNISIEKDNQISIFTDNVLIKTLEGNTIKAEYVKYDKRNSLLIIKDNIIAVDSKNNIIETNYAEYDDKNKFFKSIGKTKITTTDNYTILGSDIFFKNNETISSEKDTLIEDLDKNKIYIKNFEYLVKDNIFKSIGYIKIEDIKDNLYEFSQLYIDTKKKEIIGTDAKAFLNDENFKINEKNNTRVFANSLSIAKSNTVFKKSNFTICAYRENDKCPPWSIQASEMKHDNKNKTIYYDNVIIKIYDIPILYLPKFSHPDPSVERRSGFLPPSFSQTKSMGQNIVIPYFFNISKDKNFTLTSKLFYEENPLFLGEYHQAFKNADFKTEFGYSEGYKKLSSTKTEGSKSHLFSRFIKDFKIFDDSNARLSIQTENVTNDDYLETYKIKSDLVDYKEDMLENYIDFTYEKDDLFFGINASVYETTASDYNDKYEYVLPEINFAKSLVRNENFGNLDLFTNLFVNNYNTNEHKRILVNDFNWNSNYLNNKSIIQSELLGNLRNINYETKNVEHFKSDTTSEIHGVIGYFAKIDLEKIKNNFIHNLTPKILIRYAPGSMRKETEGFNLNPDKAFEINRLNNIYNVEKGLSTTLGFDYKIQKGNKKFDFSVAQIINEEENSKMHDKTSLDEKLSDLVGSNSIKLNDNFDVTHNYNLDQNYQKLNYNEIGANFNFNPFKINFTYLLENKHIGDQEYFKTKIDLLRKDKGLLSFETKRNLARNSSEFYNLSYEYITDCLRAGLVYRREFYNDSEQDSENSLMFKLTLIPFGDAGTTLIEK